MRLPYRSFLSFHTTLSVLKLSLDPLLGCLQVGLFLDRRLPKSILRVSCQEAESHLHANDVDDPGGRCARSHCKDISPWISTFELSAAIPASNGSIRLPPPQPCCVQHLHALLIGYRTWVSYLSILLSSSSSPSLISSAVSCLFSSSPESMWTSSTSSSPITMSSLGFRARQHRFLPREPSSQVFHHLHRLTKPVLLRSAIGTSRR